MVSVQPFGLIEKLLPLSLLISEKGQTASFEEAVRQVMLSTNFGGPHKRLSPESFYTNSWPECFCQTSAVNPADKCPPDNVLDILDSQLATERIDDSESIASNLTSDVNK
ncbi:Uncharacterized protein Adt_22047 [Abeliophyllum distichum]|uniref:Uncharacterized protein n=1 Tax=Abeliophyllum distichum TaxID=126358 RepID=A0ABD1T1A9_9LAMI